MKREKFIRPFRVANGKHFRLKDHDPGDTRGLKSQEDAVELLAHGISQMEELQEKLYAQDRWALLVMFQAMDAAGKDSAIKHVMSGVNPQGCEVDAFKQPSPEELDHDYLWRASKALPRRGHIGIFNRSYYEEVLIVRVHDELLQRERLPNPLVTKHLWKERFEDIVNFERYLIRNGIVIRKFFLNVSKEEQKKRFLERLKEPEKNWKLSPADVAERERWNDYMAAYEEMIAHTASEHAPWFVVPADNKWFTRAVVAEVIVDTLEKLKLDYPKVDAAQRKKLADAMKRLIQISAANAMLDFDSKVPGGGGSMAELKHGFASTNGIKMHYVEVGAGPLVVLCHGWPESWYSWRHQLPALAEAGFRVVAPDQRGYGQTDKPAAIEAYNILNLVSDIVGLVNTLGQERAVIVGHDWGAPVAWTSALLRTDMFRGLGLLSVPYTPRSPMRPAMFFKAITQSKNFYQEYFQEPGRVEQELETDVSRTMLGALYCASGDATAEERFKFLFEKNQRFVDTFVMPEKLPPWLNEQDLAFFTNEFKQSGFRGGINWYRNMDRNWELTPFLDGAKIIRPTVFAAGDRDIVMDMAADGYKNLESNVANLYKKHLIPGAGHWIQQERPKEINQLLIDFPA